MKEGNKEEGASLHMVGLQFSSDVAIDGTVEPIGNAEPSVQRHLSGAIGTTVHQGHLAQHGHYPPVGG